MRRRQNPKTRMPPKRRRYHLVDDGECVFDTSNPDWLVGAD